MGGIIVAVLYIFQQKYIIFDYLYCLDLGKPKTYGFVVVPTITKPQKMFSGLRHSTLKSA